MLHGTVALWPRSVHGRAFKKNERHHRARYRAAATPIRGNARSYSFIRPSQIFPTKSFEVLEEETRPHGPVKGPVQGACGEAATEPEGALG